MKQCKECGNTSALWSSKYKCCKVCYFRNHKHYVMPKVAKKQKQNLTMYSKVRKEYLASHETCEASLAGCTHTATDIHHKKGRGIYLNDSSTFLAVCRNCHNYIELHPDFAKQKGYSLSRLN